MNEGRLTDQKFTANAIESQSLSNIPFLNNKEVLAVYNHCNLSPKLIISSQAKPDRQSIGNRIQCQTQDHQW